MLNIEKRSNNSFFLVKQTKQKVKALLTHPACLLVVPIIVDTNTKINWKKVSTPNAKYRYLKRYTEGKHQCIGHKHRQFLPPPLWICVIILSLIICVIIFPDRILLACVPFTILIYPVITYIVFAHSPQLLTACVCFCKRFHSFELIIF